MYQPTVDMGDAVYPVLTSQAYCWRPVHRLDRRCRNYRRVRFRALGTLDESSASFFLEKNGLQLAFPAMEASLRMALNSGLAEKSDFEIINGSKGLLNGSNLANHNVSAVTTFANYLSQFAYGRVDGRYATDLPMIRVLMGAPTFAHCGTVYRSTDADFTALDSIMEKNVWRQSQRSCSGCRVEATKRRDPDGHEARPGSAHVERRVDHR